MGSTDVELDAEHGEIGKMIPPEMDPSFALTDSTGTCTSSTCTVPSSTGYGGLRTVVQFSAHPGMYVTAVLRLRTELALYSVLLTLQRPDPVRSSVVVTSRQHLLSHSRYGTGRTYVPLTYRRSFSWKPDCITPAAVVVAGQSHSSRLPIAPAPGSQQ